MAWGNMIAVSSAILNSLVASPNDGKAIDRVNHTNLSYYYGVCNGATEQDTAFLNLVSLNGPPFNAQVQITETGLYVFGIPRQLYPTDTAKVNIKGPHGTTNNWRTLDSLSNGYTNLQLFDNGVNGGFGANILDVKKQSTLPGAIYGILKFSNPSESLVAQVDTAGLKGTDWAVNAKLLSGYTPTAPGTVRLTSYGVADTTLPFTVTESQGMGMYVAKTVVLRSLTGISKNLENKLDKLVVSPSIVNGNSRYVNFNRHFDGFIYNAFGQKVSSIDADKVEAKILSPGVNFLVDKYNEPQGKIIFVK